MRRSERRTGAAGSARSAKLLARGGNAKTLPLLQAVWEQVGGGIFSFPPVINPAARPGADDAPEEAVLDCTTIAEDSLDAAGVDLWGPVAVAVPGDARDTARQARVIAELLGRIGAVVLDVRGTWCAGPEWACGLLAALQRFRALGLECVITAGNHAKAVRALPGVPEGLVFSGVEEAVWAALQIVGG